MPARLEHDAGLARRALADLDVALSRPGAEAFERCFEPDVLFIGSGDGEEATSRDELLALVLRLSDVAASASFEIDWVTLEETVTTGVARVAGHGIVRATGSLAHLDGTRYRLTGVLVESAAGWRWQLYHGSEPSRMPDQSTDRGRTRRPGRRRR